MAFARCAHKSCAAGATETKMVEEREGRVGVRAYGKSREMVLSPSRKLYLLSNTAIGAGHRAPSYLLISDSNRIEWIWRGDGTVSALPGAVLPTILPRPGTVWGRKLTKIYALSVFQVPSCTFG